MGIRRSVISFNQNHSAQANAQGAFATATAYSFSPGSYTATAQLIFYANGSAQVWENSSISGATLVKSWNWLVGGDAGAVDLKIESASGLDVMDGFVVGTRYVLSTTRVLQVSLTSTTEFEVSNTFTYALVSNSSGSTMSSNTGTLTAGAGQIF